MTIRDRRLEAVERLWRRRFGQPPPIRTDADLMLAVLRNAGPQVRGVDVASGAQAD